MSETEQGGVSRRTVTKAMAWAVPAVAVASTVPTAAASVCDPTFSYGAGSCKCPGSGQNVKQYYLRLCVTDVSGCSGGDGDTLYVWSIKNNSQAPGVLTPAGGFPVAIPIANGSGCASVSQRFDWIPEGSGSSAGQLRFFFNFDGSSNAGAVWSDTIAAPPDCDEGLCGD